MSRKVSSSSPSSSAVPAAIPLQPGRFLGAAFDSLPDSSLVREAQLVQSSKRPESKAPLPFSAPTLWRKVKAGTFPKPMKLSERVTAWRVGDIRAWLASQSQA